MRLLRKLIVKAVQEYNSEGGGKLLPPPLSTHSTERLTMKLSKLLLILTLISGSAFSNCCCSNLPDRFGGSSPRSPCGMVWIPGGEFNMGSESKEAKKDEQPVHKAYVDGFWMDATLVTNAQFQKFVDATGYITTAEKAPTLEEIMSQVPPGTPPPAPELLVAASLVFKPANGPVSLKSNRAWWEWKPGADWKHPWGPESSIVGKEDHPVVQVTWDDAVAYAKWAGKELPTEAQWGICRLWRTKW
jgi:sulfatase modifying factor 1